MQPNTLTGLIRERRQREDIGLTFIKKGRAEEFLSYGDLYRHAVRGLYFLQESGLRPGDELVFQIEDNKIFIISFWACVLGGIIPVPLSTGRTDDHRQKVFNVWRVLKNPYLLGSRDSVDRLRSFGGVKGLDGVGLEMESRFLEEAGLLKEEPLIGQLQAVKDGWIHEGGPIYEALEEDIAFIQFSSGSTGQPKGVILTHRNLLTNMADISRAASYSAGDTMLSWMPLTHDMGLIGFHLNPLLAGLHHYLIPTGDFVRHPALWLDKASQHRITILCSPNFGYRYLLKHCDPSRQGWDLSGVRLLYNGAEPVSISLCREFLDRLSGSGLKRTAMCPVYGLAEASLAVSVSGLDDEVIAMDLDRGQLNIGDRIVAVREQEAPVALVNVGKAIDHCALRIADGMDTSVGEGVIGHIQIKGRNVTKGYYNNEAATKKLFTMDGWVRTGDIGYIHAGSLYITGREKDIIFVNGQNFYPQDIERIAEEVEGIELNKIAVAGSFNEELQKEETIAFVFHREKYEHFIPRARALKEYVNRMTGLELDHILPVKDMPRTTSGKLQRFKLLEQFRTGELSGGLSFGMEDAGPSPRGLVEEKLAAIWESILRSGRVGVSQDFFSIGGNSLRAAEMTMAILRTFHVELTVATIYEHPTIGSLAIVIEGHEKQAYLPAPVVPIAESYPLSSAQRRLYYNWQLDRDSIAYNIPVAFRIEGELSVMRLEESIRQLIRRHDALRSVFLQGMEPVLIVRESVDFELVCTPVGTQEVDERLRALVRPFDLLQAPLFRVELLKLVGGGYILFLDCHHIILDGLSIAMLMTELQEAYAGNDLPILSHQYKDYIAWEKGYQESEKLQAQKIYWTGQLRDEWPVLDLPTDFPRPVLFNTNGGKLSLTLSDQETRRLKQLAAVNKCTLHVLLLAAYNILLSTYTRQEEVMVGIPTAGRRHPDWQNVSGMFVNNLPLRTLIKDGESFCGLLLQQRRLVDEALDNQDYPFEALMQLTRSQRDISRNPLFDTMFIYQNMVLPRSAGTEIGLSRQFFDPGCSKFDLSLEVFEGTAELELAFEYASELFRKETIQALAGNFRRLLCILPDHLHTPVSLLPWTGMNDYDHPSSTYNTTDCSYPDHTTIHRLFEEQVQRTPSLIAAEQDEERLSYAQLNDKADELAASLRKRGVKTGDIIGLLLPRSIDCIVSILGVLKAGGCYLPLESGWPRTRIDQLIASSGCRLVIDGDRIIGLLAADAAGEATGAAAAGATGPSADVMEPESSRQLAYIIYTSGSTGEPKGVMIEHRSLVNYITWAASRYCKDEPAAFPFYTSLAFDLTVTSIFVPLITGGRIVVYEEDDQQPLIGKVIRENKVDIVKLTPAHLQLVTQSKLSLPAGTRIRRLIVGGDRLDTRLARSIHDIFEGRIEIYNEYGPTEATVGCMIHLFAPDSQGLSVPIGVPASNTQIYILDKSLRPVPTGVKGELYIAGHGLARGYLFNDMLTRQRFIANPFVTGTLLYKTGDLARRFEDGTIDYIGRIDRQVKINGYRIELPEIEEHLEANMAIRKALVTTRADSNGHLRLCAYYLSDEELAISLRAWLAGRLPVYMIPAHFTRLDTFPLTGNGKVDLSALPAPAPYSLGEESRLASNDREALLIKIWKEVLGVDRIGVMDNFFELGGDSIKAFQIASRSLEEGWPIQAKEILTHQTIGQISRQAIPNIHLPMMEQGQVMGDKPLIAIEEWFFSQRFVNPNYYNQSVLLRWNKKVDERALAAAFKILITHHDGLRLNYDPVGKQLFYNDRHLESEFALIIGESGLDWASIKGSMDIMNGLLLKAAMLRNAGGGDLLFITAHHLVMDGLSWRILLEDLQLVYQALTRGERIRLRPKTAAPVQWRAQLLEGRSVEEDEYWAAIERIDFRIPVDEDSDDWRVENMHTSTGSLHRERTAQLLTADILTVLNMALVLTLKEWTGLDHCIVEQENHGRHLDTVDVSRTVGWFTAMYPLLMELKGSGIGEQLKAIRQQLQTVPRQGMGYGLGRVVPARGEEIVPARKEEIAQLPQEAIWRPRRTAIRFNYLGRFDNELNNELFAYSGLSHGPDSDPRNQLTVQLEWNVMVRGGELHLSISYNKKAHRSETISRLRDTFFDWLDKLLDFIKEEGGIAPAGFEEVELSDEDWKLIFK